MTLHTALQVIDGVQYGYLSVTEDATGQVVHGERSEWDLDYFKPVGSPPHPYQPTDPFLFPPGARRMTTPIDAVGNILIEYNPGRYHGVIVLRPVDSPVGFLRFTTEELENSISYGEPFGGFYWAEAIDTGNDNVAEVLTYTTDCDPDCAGSDITTELLAWNGETYVPAGGQQGDVRRLAGSERTGTAVEISRDGHGDGTAEGVVLARADAFPDALAAGPVAFGQGPVLLTSSSALSPVTAAELTRVLTPGGTVYIAGGLAAMSADVEEDVAALGFTPVRLAGATRYATAAAVADQATTDDRFAGTVMVADGNRFEAALVASWLAVIESAAVVLTNGGDLPSETARFLNDNPQVDVWAVGASAVDALTDAGVSSERTFDEGDASALSVAVSQFVTARHPSFRFVAVASAENFPDALAGGVHAGAATSPLLLVQPSGPTPVAAGFVADLDPTPPVVVYGGSAAVGDDAIASLLGQATQPADAPAAVRQPATSREQSLVEFVAAWTDGEPLDPWRGASAEGVVAPWTAGPASRVEIVDDGTCRTDQAAYGQCLVQVTLQGGEVHLAVLLTHVNVDGSQVIVDEAYPGPYQAPGSLVFDGLAEGCTYDVEVSGLSGDPLTASVDDGGSTVSLTDQGNGTLAGRVPGPITPLLVDTSGSATFAASVVPATCGGVDVTCAHAFAGEHPVEVVPVDDSVACDEAVSVADRYFNDPSVVHEGSGGYGEVGDWACQLTTIGETEATGRLGSCDHADGRHFMMWNG